MWHIKLAQTNIFPDWMLRLVIRIMLNINMAEKARQPFDIREKERLALITRLKTSPIAIETDKPNVQHYEVPSDFFKFVLGENLKYSCCYWPEGVSSLEDAETTMLELTTRRAEIQDGMKILDLGCGWGSFSLWAAQKFPQARITAVSNSRTQKEFIDSRCATMGINNIRTLTADVADLHLSESFDRVVSIELFEHMKNYQSLLKKIALLLRNDGKLFVHIFSSLHYPYEYDAGNPRDWMAQTFFTAGLMPTDDLLLHFQDDLILEGHWRINGLHYARTLNAWLARMNENKAQVLPVLSSTYGEADCTRWWVNWKLFFLGCAETWNLKRGREYIVSHYLFSKRG